MTSRVDQNSKGLVPWRLAEVMRKRARWLASLLVIIGGGAWPAWAQSLPQVTIEIATAADAPLSAQQHWYHLFQDRRDVRVRLRRATSDDQPSREDSGAGDERFVTITGLLSSEGVLSVPGGRFKLRDRTAAQQWCDELLRPSDSEPAAPNNPFNVPSRALAEVRSALAVPVTESTAEIAPRKVLAMLESLCPLPLEFPAGLREELSSDSPRRPWVGDDLEGVACGTALAWTLRTAGLGFAPRAAGRLRLVVAPLERGRASWPVGTVLSDGINEQLPTYFDFLNVEFNDVPLLRALDSIQQRLEVPLLWDHYALKQQQIKPEEARLDLPRRRTAYVNLTRQILRTVKLQPQVAVDEANRPLLWITSQRHPDSPVKRPPQVRPGRLNEESLPRDSAPSDAPHEEATTP